MVAPRLLNALTQSVPVDLREEVMKSFFVPQLSPRRHGEPFLHQHLERVLDAMRSAADGVFHPSVPDEVKALMQTAAEQYADIVEPYVLLHDLDAGNCLTLSYGAVPVEPSWRDWKTSLRIARIRREADPDELLEYLRRERISSISHDQSAFGERRRHARMTADRLIGREDVSDLVVRAIRIHEVALAFTVLDGVNIPHMAETFGQWGAEEIGFGLLACYADEMGGLDAKGEQNIPDFLNMAKSYLAWMKFNEVFQRLITMTLNEDALQRELNALRSSPTAFDTETVTEAVERIKKAAQK